MSKILYEVEFVTDIPRATKIASVLYDQFKARKGFFEGYEMPEYIPPKGISRSSLEYALYLTYIISIDFQTDAIELWKRAREAYENYPVLFTPEKILSTDHSMLKAFVRRLGARYPSSGASAWKRISQILTEKYQGDPRNITKETVTLAELKKRLQEFPYLRGKKLIAFYIRAMGENKFFKIKDFDNLSVAVDSQVARFTLYTGLLKLTRGSFYGCVHEEPIRPMIESLWSQATNSLGVPAWYLDEPVWTAGSKLCSKKLCHRCPVESLCEKRFDVEFRGGHVRLTGKV